VSPRLEVLSPTAHEWRWASLGAAALLGAYVALSGSSPRLVLEIAVAVAYMLFAARCLREPLFFLLVYVVALEIFPPLYRPRHEETPIYLALALFPVGVSVAAGRFQDMHFTWDPLAKGLAVFLLGTGCSLPFAFWLSGNQTGMESLARWLLLAQMGYLFYLIRAGAHRKETTTERLVYPLLLIGAALSAGYGIVDFIWPVPLPHPTPNQYIWLGTGVVRRAQGVFYDSMNFANFAAIFLVIASAAFLAKRHRSLGAARWGLVPLIAVLCLAVLVSFARSTGAAIAVALLVFGLRTGMVKTRRLLALCLALAVPFLLLWMFSPDLWRYFLSARVETLADILSHPNDATSGRYETWFRVLDIIRENPQYLIFGIGYKTLNQTRLFHGGIIVDNGYLSLLLETGLAGLAGFLVFSTALLRTFARLSRRAENHPSPLFPRLISRSREGGNPVVSNLTPALRLRGGDSGSGKDSVAFWSAVMLSLWVGELVQLLAVDAYTFWRNMVILVALMALTLNRAERLAGSPEPLRGEQP